MAKRFTAVGFLLALASTAHAQTALNSVYPPPEYDKPFEGFIINRRLQTEDEMRDVCPLTRNMPVAIGCAIRINEGKGCVIIMVADEVILSYRITPEMVRRHEIGHCNGWPSTHPGAIVVRPGDEARK
jgi:hypothetical protein